MYSSSDETGIITAYIEKLEEQSIPRALALKKRIESGELLNEIDIMYFEDQLANASSMMPMLKHHPEYQKLIAELASLYHEISEHALNNEVSSKK
jgi:hypothetical protein